MPLSLYGEGGPLEEGILDVMFRGSIHILLNTVSLSLIVVDDGIGGVDVLLSWMLCFQLRECCETNVLQRGRWCDEQRWMDCTISYCNVVMNRVYELSYIYIQSSHCSKTG